MNARVEVNPKLTPVAIPGRLLNEIFTHARESHPEECCGLLTGRSPGSFEAVHRCRNEMTRLHRRDPVAYPRGGREAFHMSERDYLRVLREAEVAGVRVTGVYHSHVDAGAYFSELDQEFALQDLFPFPEVHHLVVSIIDGVVKDVAAFRWVSEVGRFEGRTLAAETP